MGSAIFKVVWYVSFFLSKNLALLVSAVGSAVAPAREGISDVRSCSSPWPKVEGSGNKRAASATLLNQAMSFAAVAAVTMRLGTKSGASSDRVCFVLSFAELPRSGAMQTDTFKHDLNNAAQDPPPPLFFVNWHTYICCPLQALSLSSPTASHSTSQVALQLLALPASVAQGQGSSDAGSGSMSGQCLLQLLYTDDSIHNVHMLMSLWPALLVAPWAAPRGDLQKQRV